MTKRTLLLIVGLIALLVFQIKLVMPFVYDIISSDLFLEDSGDEQNRLSSNNEMTNEAFSQCNAYITSEYDDGVTFKFGQAPINAFSLGNFQYVINADTEIIPADAASYSRRYVCRIKYNNQKDTTGLTSGENWSVEGISGLDDL